LLHRVPGLAHGQEGRVRHGLGVGCDAVVLAGREIDVLGVEASEDGFDFGKGGVGSAVLDEDLCSCVRLSGCASRIAGKTHQRLVTSINVWSV
jgi:hypothetical protein